MSGMIFGREFLEIANALHLAKDEDYVYKVYGDPKHAKLHSKAARLLEEIEQLLPEQHRGKMVDFDNLKCEIDVLWFEHEYKVGFVDGLAVMQALIFMACGKSVNGEIARLLAGYYYSNCIKGESEKKVTKFLQDLLAAIAEREQLEDIERAVCFGKLTAAV